LRRGLSELVQRITRMELRVADAKQPQAPSQSAWIWDQPCNADQDRLLLGHPLRVLLLFDPADSEHAKALHVHLSPLVRRGAISLKRMDDVRPGDTVDEVLTGWLQEAQVVLVLLSAPLLDNDRCRCLIELALLRKEAGAPRVVPVLLRPCLWEGTQ